MRFGIKKRDDAIGTEIDAFRGTITSLFDDFFNIKPTGLFDSCWNPAMDMEEDEKNIYIRADLPGMDEKDIQVVVEGNTLSVTGEKRLERVDKGKSSKTLLAERCYGQFRRTVRLPEDVQLEKISAEMKKGVLHVTVPKEKQEKAKTIKVAIK
ncbi:MAG: Hsp20/alpha crystallin family protein [Spirochaetes bacterium]|nr:Hsp20/alpha crystallin family protein [Spirochaetota bacterium]